MNFSRYKKIYKYKNILFIVIFIIALLIIYYSINRKELSSVELFFKGIINKAQSVIYKPHEEKKNEEMYKTEITSLKSEIGELKKLLVIKNTFSNYESINATVLYRNVGYWYDFLTIDKGSKDGIKDGMLVTGSQGLIGITKNVSKYSSDVTLLTAIDEENRITVGIMNGDKTIYGLINGYDYIKKELIINDVVDDINYVENMSVVTSGLTGTYPEGILIGKVTSIEKDKYGISKVIRVKCNADFSSIRYVTVLKESK